MPHLGAIMARLGAIHLAAFVRSLVANMSKKLLKNTILEPTSRKHSTQDAQTPLPSLLKLQKKSETVKFFNVFRFPAHLLKSSKNAPRIPPEAPKLSS